MIIRLHILFGMLQSTLLKPHAGLGSLWMKTNIMCATTQVGNMAVELALWTRPEDMAQARPSFAAASPGAAADVMGQASAALAAASLAFLVTDAPFAGGLLAAARQLFALAAGAEGLYSLAFAPNQKVSFWADASHHSWLCIDLLICCCFFLISDVHELSIRTSGKSRVARCNW
jgi:hypothetical protein